MLGKRLSFWFKSSPSSKISSPAATGEEEKGKSLSRKAVSFVLMTATGSVALSALKDLAIYHGCSSKAMERANTNQALKDAIGEPISKGPWYNASLAISQKQHSVSCTFPVSGPQGTGVFQLRAVRNEDDTWSSYFWPRDWEILIMDALLHVPGNEEKEQTFRINVPETSPDLTCEPCTTTVCKTQESASPEKK